MLDRLIDLLIMFAHRLRFMTVVDQDENAVLMRWGKCTAVLEPGRHWICPVMHTTRNCKVVQETMRLYDQGLTTRDDENMTVSAIVTFKVVDPKRYLLETDGASAIDDVTYGAVSEWIHKNTRDYVRDPANWSDLARRIRSAAEDYGVYIVRVRFGDFIKARAIRLLGTPSQ